MNRLIVRGLVLLAIAGTELLGRFAEDHSRLLAQVPVARVAATPNETSSDGLNSSATEGEAQGVVDAMRELQAESMRSQKPVYGHWGNQPDRFSNWLNHSNRLIPVYTFGITLDALRREGSVYADADRLRPLYGRIPDATLNADATYFDQTDLYRLQWQAIRSGKRNIILMIFDGMDWQTTRAASIYKRGQVAYQEGRGTGLAIQDERRVVTDFGLVVTSSFGRGAKTDLDAQRIVSYSDVSTGGYDVARGGGEPWGEQSDRAYLMGLDRQRPHSVTDSAAAASSVTSGVKTYNGAINLLPDGTQVVPIARQLQSNLGKSIGVVTSVPISHATPAAAYANNVSRKDYQDLARDLLGLPSAAHRRDPPPGVDVLIGGGWGETKATDVTQGNNFAAGNPYLHQSDLEKSDRKRGGRYHIAQRTADVAGDLSLASVAGEVAAIRSAGGPARLLGFYGVQKGHLPFQTANGDYHPTFDAAGTERYTPADIRENPTLADMTRAALTVLETDSDGFWLMVEAGDVDWANHANNLDNSIGATLSGDAAFAAIMEWMINSGQVDDTAVIVTADHGHYLVLDHPEVIAEAGRQSRPR